MATRQSCDEYSRLIVRYGFIPSTQKSRPLFSSRASLKPVTVSISVSPVLGWRE
jgi:hypothetical protein